jgi:hypothetical protein
MPVVELHGYRGVDVPGPLDVTAYVSDLSWTHSTARPWETIDLALNLPIDLWQAMLPGLPANSPDRTPSTGFWVVVKTPNSRGSLSAVAWGRATRVRVGLSVVATSGHQSIQPVRIACESWLSTLSKSRVLLAASDNAWGKPGFVYKMQSWGPALKALLRSMGERNPGTILDALWREIVRVTVPDTLAGADLTLGQQVPVVFDQDSADASTPMRKLQHKDVPGYAINAFGSVLPQSTIWQWLESTFGADPSLVELFPSLEFPSFLAPKGSEGNGADNAEPVYTQVGKALGAQPVLIYRLRPVLLEGITQAAVSRAVQAATHNPAAQVAVPASQQIGTFQVPISEEPGVPVDWYDFPADEIRGLPLIEWSDDDRCNMVYSDTPIQPKTQIALHGILGTPIVDADDVARHGLRIYEAAWPFLPATIPDDEPAGRETLSRRLDSLIEYTWVAAAKGETYARGQFSSVYKPWVKAGMYGTAEIRQGQKPKILTFYIDSVTHSVHVDAEGAIDRISEVHYSRGVLSPIGVFISPLATAGSNQDDTPPDVTFGDDNDTPASTQPPEDVLTDGPTEHFTWADLLCHNESSATLQQRANMARLAKNLETLGAYLGAFPVLTPNGGLHGAYQDLHHYPIRQSTSQHRKGKAADFTVAGSTKAQIVTAIQHLVQVGTMDPGGIYTYPDRAFVHYDIRGVDVPEANGADSQEQA